MKLVNPTDDELNAAFAEKVAGLSAADIRYLGGSLANPASGIKFTTSADAVLPWLEKWGPWTVEHKLNEPGYKLDLWKRIPWVPPGYGHTEPPNCVAVHFGCANCFPRAAVIAMLWAHGVEVETS